MKIAISVINNNEKLRGPDRYSVELVNHLIHIDNHNAYYIFYASWQKYIEELININKPNIHLIRLDPPKNRFLRALWQSFVFQHKIKKVSPDIIHYTNLIPFFFKKYPVISTVHGVEEYTMSNGSNVIGSALRKLIAKTSIANSDKLITVSQYCDNSVKKMFHIDERNCRVILEGVNPELFQSNNCKKILEKYVLIHKYILCVGIIEERKNMVVIIDAFSKLVDELKNNYKIVIAGKKGNAYTQLVNVIKSLKLQNKVLFLDHVSAEDLPCIYNNAQVFVFPSKIESFGLPVLEAMACSTPVVASNATSLPEVCGNAAVLVSPGDIDGWKNAIELVLIDDIYRKRLIEKGLERTKSMSWYTAANETLNEYNMLALENVK